MIRKNVKAFELPTSYVAYDLETSDLYPQGEIVEFGAVRVEDGQATGEFSELCALPGGMNPEASEVNGITDEMLFGKRPLPEVFADFCAFVGSLPLVGFNNKHFDDLFIAREAERSGVESPTDNGTHDAMLIHGRATLATCLDEFGIENNRAHRALSDARATSQLYDALRIHWAMNSTDVRDVTAEVVGDELRGQVVCFTGTTDFYPKRPCQTLALAHGATLSNSVTKKVTLLVNLEGRRSTKVAKAEQYGVRIVDARAFLEMVGHPADEPVSYDVLQTGIWLSNLGDEAALMVRRELGLPVHKQLVYYHKNGSKVVLEKNQYGVTVPKNVPIVETVPVIDVRVVGPAADSKLSRLEIILEGEAVPFRILSAYLADMQKGKEFYLDKTNGLVCEE